MGELISDRHLLRAQNPVFVPVESLVLSDTYPPLPALLLAHSEALLPRPGVKIVSKGEIEGLWGLRLEMVLRKCLIFFPYLSTFAFFGGDAHFPSLMSLL